MPTSLEALRAGCLLLLPAWLLVEALPVDKIFPASSLTGHLVVRETCGWEGRVSSVQAKEGHPQEGLKSHRDAVTMHDDVKCLASRKRLIWL